MDGLAVDGSGTHPRAHLHGAGSHTRRKARSDRNREGVEAGNARWEIVERYLKGHDYLAGDSLSIGDIPIGIWANRWFNLPVERNPLPLLEAWYRRLCERPAFEEHVMIPLM